MTDAHPPLHEREALVLAVLRDLTTMARERDAEAPRPTFFDQAAIEAVVGMATGEAECPGSLDALVRYGLAVSQRGSRSFLAFAITDLGNVEANRPRRMGIRVPRSIGGQG